MFINSALGLFGIYAQIELILSWFGKNATDYSVCRACHSVLVLRALYLSASPDVTRLTRARSNSRRRHLVNACYIIGSLLIYGAIWLSRG